jgi:hypothetical protein
MIKTYHVHPDFKLEADVLFSVKVGSQLLGALCSSKSLLCPALKVNARLCVGHAKKILVKVSRRMPLCGVSFDRTVKRHILNWIKVGYLKTFKKTKYN